MSSFYTQIQMYVSSTNPSTPESSSVNYYVKSGLAEKHTFIQDEFGNVRQSSLPSGTTNYTLRYDGNEWSSTSSLKISTTEVVVNDNAINVDFRVEGITLPNLIFLDASADSIGINNATPNPNTSFDISGNKPMKFNTMSTAGINGLTAAIGMVTVDTDIYKAVIRLQNGITAQWRYIDNPLNHPGKGIKTTNANYNVQSTDHLIFADISGGAVTLFLPSSPVDEEYYIIRALTAAIFPLTIDGNGHNIDGSPTATPPGITAYTVVYSAANNSWYTINV